MYGYSGCRRGTGSRAAAVADKIMATEALQQHLARWRVPLGFLLGAICLIFAEPRLWSILAGSIPGLLGLLWRAWASGHLRKNERLATGGPYAYTRNPLYFGSFLLGAGFSIATGRITLAILFVVCFMKFRVLIIALLMILLAIAGITVFGQSEVNRTSEKLTVVNTTDAKFTEVRNRLRDSLPFQPGEELSYEMKLSRFPIYGTIGILIFKVEEESAEKEIDKDKEKEEISSPPIESKDSLQPQMRKIYVEAKSKGLLTSLFNVKVNDVFTSYIDSSDFGV